MSKLQSFRRIIIEDYPEKERELVGKLASSINIFAEDVTATLNKNVSIDNLAETQKNITITVDASGVPTRPAQVLTGLNKTCAGTLVIKAINNTTVANVPSATPFITFTNNAASIIISNVSGLTANEQYTLTIKLYPNG